MISDIAGESGTGRKIRVMFQDEGRFGRVSLPRKSWAPGGMRPICRTQIIREYTYVYSAVSPADGMIDSLIAPVAAGEVMTMFLHQVAERFPDEHIIMIMDRAAWHTTGKLSLPENISLCFLPPYSPQLNPVEHLWKEIRQNYFANRVFRDMSAVEDQLFEALTFMNRNRNYVKSFSAFDWIFTNNKIAN